MLRRRASLPRRDALAVAPVGADEHEQELYVYTCDDCAPKVAAELGKTYVAHASAG